MDFYFDHIAGGSLDGTLTAKSDIIAEVLMHDPALPKSESVMICDRERK
ncbi:hypothetical protein LIT25_23575 [Bacillus sp. F19]|nr:hypothetical protein LIT25_23575 [Bacillus sp. F19]